MSIVIDLKGKNLQNLWELKVWYPGSDPKLTLTLTLSLALGLGLGLTPRKTMSVENLKPNAKDEYRQGLVRENLQELWEWKILYPASDHKLTLTLTLTLALTFAVVLGLGLTPGKTMSVDNLKPNAKDEYRQRLLGKNLQEFWEWKILYPASDPKLTLTLTLTIALGLGLGLTPGKTKSVENLKPNAKDEYRQRLLGKNLQELWEWKILYPASDPKLTLTLALTLALSLALGLGLA